MTSGSGDRPRKEGCHGGGVYSFFPGEGRERKRAEHCFEQSFDTPSPKPTYKAKTFEKKTRPQNCRVCLVLKHLGSYFVQILLETGGILFREYCFGNLQTPHNRSQRRFCNFKFGAVGNAKTVANEECCGRGGISELPVQNRSSRVATKTRERPEYCFEGTSFGEENSLNLTEF